MTCHVRFGMLKSCDTFSCLGHHATGFARAGIKTVQFCESNEWRRQRIAEDHPGIPIHDDIHTLDPTDAEILFGGPPCQKTSVSAAIHGRRSGKSLWPQMRRAGVKLARRGCLKLVVVEQPPGNAKWEAKVGRDVSDLGWHAARFEFAAWDVGAPYLRRRVFIFASPSLQRLALARLAFPSAIERVKRAANARGDWRPDQCAAIPVDARSAGQIDRSARSAEREQWIDALGDSNPPHMAEVIGHVAVEILN